MKLFISYFLIIAIISVSCSQNEEKAETNNLNYTFDKNDFAIAESNLSNKRRLDSLFETLRNELDTIILKNQVYYIVEGDLFMDTDELYDYCFLRLFSPLYDSATYKQKNKIQEFTMATINGIPEVWPSGKKLSYAVLRKTFESEALYDTAVNFMKQACLAWMQAADVEFEHLKAYDTINPATDPQDPVVFYVQQYHASGKFIAKAFFPSDGAFKRKVLLEPSFFSPTLQVSKVGIIRHELGHVLGARHEHIWSKEQSCKGEGVISGFRNAQQITEYDPYSVMHYLCGNAGTTTLELTDFDILGIQKVYGKKP